jgi:hypothetical protein
MSQSLVLCTRPYRSHWCSGPHNLGPATPIRVYKIHMSLVSPFHFCLVLPTSCWLPDAQASPNLPMPVSMQPISVGDLSLIVSLLNPLRTQSLPWRSSHNTLAGKDLSHTYKAGSDGCQVLETQHTDSGLWDSIIVAGTSLGCDLVFLTM